ncbi:MAG: D-alanyl-D-alanine carboxypeptidase [Oscillospiraceae bacterium]|jgi:D-alanyl-D-alanine carboxypeptidase|nr:D-alanyl-D-alanine carboxypeptidase [Oscillospiraceae bacterium]
MAAAMVVFLCVHAGASLAEDAGMPNPTVAPSAIKYDAARPESLLPEQIAAEAFLVMEMGSGEILMERNSDVAMYPASTTKIMTALLALEYVANHLDAEQTVGTALNKQVTVSDSALDIEEDSSRAGFRAGDVISLRDALYGMMLPSGNEAANVLAEYVSGSQAAFVDYMNGMASVLGMTNTNFVNANGLHDPNHYTTAQDMAKLAREAMRNTVFRQIVSTVNYTTAQIGNRAPLNLHNSNRLIDNATTYFYPNATGIKTGNHSQAAYCLVAAAERNGINILVVLLYSGYYSRWDDATRLFNYGFSQYASMTFQEVYAADPYLIQTISFAKDDERHGELELAIEPQDITRAARLTGRVSDVSALAENYRSLVSIEWTRGRQPRAPILAGEVLGVLTFYTPTGEAFKFNLISPRSVLAREDAPLTIEQIEEIVAENPFRFVGLTWDSVTPLAIIVVAAFALLRFLIRRIGGRRRDARQIPKPKQRGYR